MNLLLLLQLASVKDETISREVEVPAVNLLSWQLYISWICV
jgi:hypothetical protein